MKRVRIAALVLVALAACGEVPTEPVSRVPDPRFAADVVTIEKGRFPIGPRTVFNVCTNEFVDIVGEFNLVVRQVTDPTGKVHFFIHSVGGHVLGVGQTTGTRYVSNEHFNYVEHTGGNGATNLIIEFTISGVAVGRAPNQSVGKLQVFLTINANGEVAVEREVTEGFDECQR